MSARKAVDGRDIVKATATNERPSRAEVEAAFRTIIRWTGDDPDRDGLTETPARVTRAFEEYFSGYDTDPAEHLRTTFEETGGYDEMIVLRGIPFESHCEHHMAPIIGKVWVAYPDWTCRRDLQDRARRRRLRQAAADPGAVHGADREHDRRGAASARCRRRRKVDPPLHVDARRSQARHGYGDESHARLLPRQSGDAAGVHEPAGSGLT